MNVLPTTRGRGELLNVHKMALNAASSVALLKGAAKDIEEGGIDVRAHGAGGTGVTALHCAVGSAHTSVEVVVFLLDRGADPLKETAWFNEGELVNCFEIVLQSVEFVSLFRGGDKNNRDKPLAVQKLEVLLARHGANAASDVFCMGAGSVPVPLVLSPEMRVRKCIVGALDCAALLTDSGHVFTFGSPSNGKLGHQNKEASVGPRRVFGAIATRRITDLAVGLMHMICCDEFGAAFGWGSNRSYMLGMPMPKGASHDNFWSVPTLIESLAGVRIVAVAAGAAHSIFLSDRGWPFMAGSALQGRLGLFASDVAASSFMSEEPVRLDVRDPGRRVPLRKMDRQEVAPLRIKEVAAADGHSLLLDEEGSVWAFGIDTNGRCSGVRPPSVAQEKYSDGRAKPSRFDVRCILLPKVVERGVAAISASKTQSVLLLRDGTAWVHRDGKFKIASDMVACSR